MLRGTSAINTVRALGVALILSGCSAFMHGYTIQRVAGRTLPAGSGEGFERLRLEQAVDATLRGYVVANGDPDYIHVHSQYAVSLFYVRLDTRVQFLRSSYSTHSITPEVSRIHNQYLAEFSLDDKAILASLRNGDSGEDDTTTRSDEAVRSGTCFVVSPAGLVATSHHVVEGAAELVVALQAGGIFSAKIEAESAANDLVLLRIAAETPSYLSLAEVRSVRTGDPVFTLGYPSPSLLGSEARYTEGVISALSGLGGDASLLQITVPVQPGNSGGPLLNQQGEVVGVIAAQAAFLPFLAETGSLPQGINFAVKADVLRAMFDARARGKAPSRDRRETVEHVRGALCLVVAR